MARLGRYEVWLIVLVGLVFPGAGLSDEAVPVGYRSVAAESGIPYTVLYAVALTESGKQVMLTGVYRPWPWTLNIAGRGYYFESRLEAWQALTARLHKGQRSIRITTCASVRRFCRSATSPSRIGGPVWVVTTHRPIRNGLTSTVAVSSPVGSGS